MQGQGLMIVIDVLGIELDALKREVLRLRAEVERLRGERGVAREGDDDTAVTGR
ncbi:hypothetical protein C8J38_1011060 [Rhizobium sp. PP-WC-2G-219]|nr:hypothetical protein DFI02_101279 [Rhizobium sp. PP-F2F-G20b]TCL96696.1 hypothetical protein C8J38_1011060 [Rhizobium sp. PP-WC-2G-219]